MATITFDTLKFSDTLKQAGLPPGPGRSRGAGVLQTRLARSNVATKREIDDLRKEMQAMELRLTIKLGAFMAVVGGGIIAVLRVAH